MYQADILENLKKKKNALTSNVHFKKEKMNWITSLVNITILHAQLALLWDGFESHHHPSPMTLFMKESIATWLASLPLLVSCSHCSAMSVCFWARRSVSVDSWAKSSRVLFMKESIATWLASLPLLVSCSHCSAMSVCFWARRSVSVDSWAKSSRVYPEGRGKSNTIGSWSGLYMLLHTDALINVVCLLVHMP